jgi:hypothetical protein
LLAVLSGAFTRILLEFVLPKDGFLLLPYNDPEYYDYGPAASSLLPSIIDAPAADHWDPYTEPCVQVQFKDYTGIDSMAAFLCCILVYLTVQWAENYTGKALFSFPGDQPYAKDYGEEDADSSKLEKATEVGDISRQPKDFEESSDEQVKDDDVDEDDEIDA